MFWWLFEHGMFKNLLQEATLNTVAVLLIAGFAVSFWKHVLIRLHVIFYLGMQIYSPVVKLPIKIYF